MSIIASARSAFGASYRTTYQKARRISGIGSDQPEPASAQLVKVITSSSYAVSRSDPSWSDLAYRLTGGDMGSPEQLAALRSEVDGLLDRAAGSDNA
jgi:hypothetical protein